MFCYNMSLKANHVLFQPRFQGLTSTSSPLPLLKETTSLSQRTVHRKMARKTPPGGRLRLKWYLFQALGI